MLSRIFARLALIAGLVVAILAAAPQPEPTRWQVLVTFPSLPAEADPDSYTGRVEIYVGETWVGCAWAAWHRTGTDQITLLPIALGYAVTGRREDIHVTAYGELDRLGGMTVTIKPIGGPVIGLQDPR